MYLFSCGPLALTPYFFSTVSFALSPRRHHGMPLSLCGFRGPISLPPSGARGCTMIAALEAEHYDAEFRPTNDERRLIRSSKLSRSGNLTRDTMERCRRSETMEGNF